MLALLLAGCASSRYSTEDVLNSYRNKNDIARYMGVPTRISSYNGYTQLLYSYGGGTINSVLSNTIVTRDYDRYVLFVIDDLTGGVVRWEYQGVDLSRPKPKATPQ